MPNELPHPLRNAAKFLDPGFLRQLLHENAPAVPPLRFIDVQRSFMSNTGGLAVTDTEGYLRALPPSVQRFPQHHITHSSFWINKSGDPPKPYSIITAKDIRDGKFRPKSGNKSEVQEYLESLPSRDLWIKE